MPGTHSPDPLRVAVFTGTFPAISDTFIVRQITALIGRGHAVDIFADTAGEPGARVDSQTSALFDRVTYVDMPPETAPWGMTVWPPAGRTWPPGATKPVHNSIRFARAVPKLLRCFA